MMKMIYFNDKYPENKTLKLINRKDNILQVHRNEGWEYVDKESVIDEIIDNTNYEVDTYYDVKSEDFSNFAKKHTIDLKHYLILEIRTYGQVLKKMWI